MSICPTCNQKWNNKIRIPLYNVTDEVEIVDAHGIGLYDVDGVQLARLLYKCSPSAFTQALYKELNNLMGGEEE